MMVRLILHKQHTTTTKSTLHITLPKRNTNHTLHNTQQTTNNKQHITNNKQQTTNNIQQTNKINK